ncbi:MAG: TlpA family protein disulfide reductase [Acidimicrobiia bacterium]
MPVVDEVAKDYKDKVRFLAVAGRSDLDRTSERADQLFEHLDWVLADDIWDLFGVPYQPVTILISGGDVVFDTWPGARGEDEIRQRLDAMLEALAA